MKPATATGRLLRSVGIGLAVAALLIGVLWIALSKTKSPAQEAAEREPPPVSVVTTEVEQGSLVSKDQFDCVMKAGRERSAKLAVSPQFAQRAVVTARPLKNGALVRDGQVLIEISGRPVIAIEGALPPYRDLRLGDYGPDVAQLQTALLRMGFIDRLARQGTLDLVTSRAVTALYTARGYTAPADFGDGPDGGAGDAGGAPPAESFADGPAVWLSSESVSVAHDTRVRFPGLGVGVDADGKTLVFHSGVLQAECDMGQDPSLANLPGVAVLLVGSQQVPVRAVDGAAPGRTSEPDGGTTDQGLSEGAILIQVVPKNGHELPNSVRPGDKVRLELASNKAEGRGLLVPVSALWTDADGTSAVRVADPDTRVVKVEIVATHEGLAMVRAITGRLSVGDRVIVTGEP